MPARHLALFPYVDGGARAWLRGLLLAIVACAGAGRPAPAAAIDWNLSGQVRQEIAYSIASNNNELNQMGNVFNDRITPHYTHSDWGSGANAAALTATYRNADGVRGFFQQGLAGGAPGTATARVTRAGLFTQATANCRFGLANARAAGSPGLAGNAAFAGVLCPNGAGSAWVPGVVPGAAGGISAQGAGLDDDINFNLFNTRAEV
ncbi:MAG: hypothetical protein RLW62_18740, partial [Gammaproteobacteria bacterium]